MSLIIVMAHTLNGSKKKLFKWKKEQLMYKAKIFSQL